MCLEKLLAGVPGHCDPEYAKETPFGGTLCMAFMW